MKNILLWLSAVFLFSLSSIAGAGGYMEYKISSDLGAVEGGIKSYFTEGNSRGEMDMIIPKMPDFNMHFLMLELKSTPGKTYMLFQKNKTYTVENKGKTAEGKDNFEISVLGNEKVDGYNCTRVKVATKEKDEDMEMWISTDIKDYAYFEGANTFYSDASLIAALQAKGVKGIPVRMSIVTRGLSMSFDLVKIEKREVSMGLFSLNGYKLVDSPDIKSLFGDPK